MLRKKNIKTFRNQATLIITMEGYAAGLIRLTVFEVAAVPIMLSQFFLQLIFALAEDTEGKKGITREKNQDGKNNFRYIRANLHVFVNTLMQKAMLTPHAKDPMVFNNIKSNQKQGASFNLMPNATS
jgi:hypothetical protein